jgi:hypothetical protein
MNKFFTHVRRNTYIYVYIYKYIYIYLGTKEMRPKSATKKRDGNISLNNNRGSGDPRDELYPKSNEELYPTARGLIRK